MTTQPTGHAIKPTGHAISAVQRSLITTTIAVVVSLIGARFTPWQASLLMGWIGGGAWFLMAVWVRVGRLGPDETQALATREDNNRFAAELLLMSASIASLAGAAFDLIKASQTDGRGKAFLTIVALLTVAVSWAVVHTVFTLRYARQYYAPPVGGIDFKNPDESPIYTDFAYTAFTVGMTFQVSDTDINTRAIRRTVLRHALLSYLFGAVILAVTVNTIASFFQ